MVTTVTSLGRSGLHDWFIQRLSAVVMAAFAIYIGWFVGSNPELQYEQWVGFFQQGLVQAFALVTVILMSLHIWVGMWIVSTDYLKPTGIRMIFQGALIIYCLVIIFWGIQILWSV
ncbi:succinate dehydrogenase, hydrophobic membrane anchor protein [Pleionea litopenaei]|uniref:Succinate dehydrogenase hydrophobic membrane anchor subunit n=1 Tax=Pleionea litopenaei TaxID=3070815 RepID=A0AA51X798_9GAMM|nr:succinate dehydrogenase, hydrophobic membrane anchor protein [Pleionea sp. HL-JVS1]WMS87983.1 succinate dehydrogenase, hydrophobic membrane anchor protein [Pleionea sp. HL-JVS1]